MQNDVARVATAIDYFLEQIVKIPQNNDVLGRVIPVVKIAQQFELELVGVTFDGLQPRIHFAGSPNVGAFA